MTDVDLIWSGGYKR